MSSPQAYDLLDFFPVDLKLQPQHKNNEPSTPRNISSKFTDSWTLQSYGSKYGDYANE